MIAIAAERVPDSDQAESIITWSVERGRNVAVHQFAPPDGAVRF